MNIPDYPPLTPITSPWMQEVVSNKERLTGLFEQYGSPINLHHIGPFAENVEAYESIFNRHNLKHNIFFARKANKCRAFAKEAHRLGSGVDTASYEELNQCLELGCDPANLVLTAAIKNERLVRLALNNDVLMILDNKDECELVNRIAGEIGKKPTVGIRVSGFIFGDKKLYSRFGFDVNKVAQLIIYHIGSERRFYNLRFGGFHFHLDGYSIKRRAAALIQTIELVDVLQDREIDTKFIDIGGGLLTNYLSDKSEWEVFWNALKEAKMGKRPPVTFGNNGLGYMLDNGELHSEPNVYPYYNENPKEQFLNQLLAYKNAKGKPIASLLRKRDIELRIEPGRSLLDQTGMTLTKVAHRKQDQRGAWLVGLEMNRSQLFSSSDDFLLDPIYIPMSSIDTQQQPTPVYFTGAYCLEGDIILKRKILLPQLPEIGDIIAFPNTAGYMMHFYETRSHLHPFTTNLVTSDGGNFVLDETM